MILLKNIAAFGISLRLKDIKDLTMQKFRLTMLFIICGNGFAYAQTFNETPIPAFTLHKEMKTPQIFKLPEIKNTLSETNPAFNNSMSLVKQYELRKNSPIWIPSSPVILISNSTDCSIPAISDTNYTVPVIHSGE